MGKAGERAGRSVTTGVFLGCDSLGIRNEFREQALVSQKALQVDDLGGLVPALLIAQVRPLGLGCR